MVVLTDGPGRSEQLGAFYSLLEQLRLPLGDERRLRDSGGRLAWPNRGLYFFFEEGELRENKRERRVVRVGTHALTATSRTTLWNRLAQHRGTLVPIGGNHRGSIFRLLVGEALLRSGRHAQALPTWGIGANAAADVRTAERQLEAVVSEVIGAMPLLWLSIPDEGGPASLRGYIERNAIGLLSNFGKPPIDPPSADWLGRFSGRAAVVQSGLWNSNHVNESCDSAFLGELERLIGQQE